MIVSLNFEPNGLRYWRKAFTDFDFTRRTLALRPVHALLGA